MQHLIPRWSACATAAYANERKNKYGDGYRLPLAALYGRKLACVKSYVFAHEFRVIPQFDLEPDYIIRKGI